MADDRAQRLILLASASQSADGQGSAVVLPTGWRYATIVLATTADTGTGTLDVRLQSTPDGGTTWYDVAAFPQHDDTTTSSKRYLVRLQTGGVDSDAAAFQMEDGTLVASTVRNIYFPEQMRVKWDLTSFTNVTFSVTGWFER